MLSALVQEPFVQLDVAADDWEEAVRVATRPFVEAGVATQDYVEDIISGAKEHGPYFVLAPRVAMPHARPDQGALGNAIGVVRLAAPVEFGSEANDPVSYLFPLVANDDGGHLEALMSLAELLSDESFFAGLDEAKTAGEVLDLIRDKEGGL